MAARDSIAGNEGVTLSVRPTQEGLAQLSEQKRKPHPTRLKTREARGLGGRLGSRPLTARYSKQRIFAKKRPPRMIGATVQCVAMVLGVERRLGLIEGFLRSFLTLLDGVAMVASLTARISRSA